MNAGAEALVTARQVLELAERIGDRQAICESELLLAECYLHSGDLDDCAAKLQSVTDQTSDSAADMGLAGEAQRLYGLLAMARSNALLAAQHFGRSVSIFDLLGDRYRGARAHYHLGRAYMLAQPERAAEHLSRAVNVFRELGARLDLASAEAALAAHDQTAPQQQRRREAVIQLVTLRLAEAVASRALLLRELAAVIRQETSAGRVVIFEPDEEQRQRIVIAHGCDSKEAADLADELTPLDSEEARALLAKKHDAKLITLKSSNALPATLLIAPQDRAQLSGGLSLDPLLRVVELGMDVCALRARAPMNQSPEWTGGVAGASLMPGFIHSSPAMTRLVEEVHKIRSSDVTVLVTGESGTGKELVARAIHALSTRRQKIFVPFTVPRCRTLQVIFLAIVEGVYWRRFRLAWGNPHVKAAPSSLCLASCCALQEGEIRLGERQPIHVDVDHYRSH
jgi:hypothetical protein